MFGLRGERQDHMLVRKVPSWMGNWLIWLVTGVPVRDMGCTLRAMRATWMRSRLPSTRDAPLYPGVNAWRKRHWLRQVEVRHHPRVAWTDQI